MTLLNLTSYSTTLKQQLDFIYKYKIMHSVLIKAKYTICALVGERGLKFLHEYSM